MYWRTMLGPMLVLLLLLGASKGGPQVPPSLLDRSWGSWRSEDQEHTIVRKTVFVTPFVKNCSDGYEWNNEQAKCLRVFKYNRSQEYHIMLERIKALYYPETKVVQKDLGPVRVNVPFSLSTSLENEADEKPIIEETK